MCYAKVQPENGIKLVTCSCTHALVTTLLLGTGTKINLGIFYQLSSFFSHIS